MNESLDGQVDRLVDGELDNDARRHLIRRLEVEPDGWRRCALAFLEAREWRAAFGTLSAADGMTAPPRLRPRATRRSRAWMAVLAAGLLAAFTVGWWLRGSPREAPLDVPVAAPREAAPPEADVTEVARTEPPADPAALSAPVDPLVRQWEQRGFQADTQQRLVTVRLRDGRIVRVPVQEVHLRDVRGRSF